MGSLTDFEPISVSQKVEWHNKGELNQVFDLDIFASEVTKKIANYVENQVREFLKDNKISEKQWLKRGVIQSLPPEIGCLSYILYYKNWRMEVRRKVSVEYKLIIGK